MERNTTEEQNTQANVWLAGESSISDGDTKTNDSLNNKTSSTKGSNLSTSSNTNTKTSSSKRTVKVVIDNEDRPPYRRFCKYKCQDVE